MRQVAIPADLLPPGAEVDGTGAAYADAVALPVDGEPLSVLTVPRTNMLYQAASPDEAKALAAGNWRVWLRLAVTPVGVLVTLEPVGQPASSRLPLNSELEP